MVAMALLIFLPAWTLQYWEAWVFLAVFFISTLSITVYLMKKDPALLERRVNAGPGAEKEKKQKLIQSLASVSFISIFIVSALDYRLAWSTVPVLFVIIGDILVILGLLLVFFVFKENTFTSAIIETGVAQKVVSTGPYAVVRHPMYIGAFIMLFGIPPALGSSWGLIAVIPITIIIIWRLLDEEVFLQKNLSGYIEYQKKVRYRLIPFIW